MPENTLRELFLEELQDMYNAEKQLTRALPKMAKAAESEDLQEAFTAHLEETEGQIVRLERVFESLGEKVKGKKCEGMEGIIEEGSSAIEEFDGAVLDAALIAGAQKVEHYEITSYGSLATFAELLGHRDVKKLLGQNLDEEKAADEKLSRLAGAINQQALQVEGDEQEENQEPASKPASAGRGGNGRGTSAKRAKSQ